jgi:hypothetical protein
MIDQATRKGAEKIQKRLKVTVETWEDQPIFELYKSPGGWGVKYDARTTAGKKFTFVSEGTKPHPEQARPNMPMAFEWFGRGNYPAKTHVGSLKSYKGITSKRLRMAPFVRMYQVMHPGIWPRDFATVIMRDEKDAILRDIVNGTKKLSAQAMHGPRLER